MRSLFGEDGFALYRLPQGQQISAEEFSEFESAYQSLTATSRFADDIRAAIENSQKPVVYVEGETDVRYLRRAAELLDRESLVDRIEIRAAGGDGNLKNIWSSLRKIIAFDDIVHQKVVLLHDCEKGVESEDEERLFKRGIPLQPGHPLGKGIENLFGRDTLERARAVKAAFIDVVGEHVKTVRGQIKTISEKWVVNEDEKTNLCNWLCENGTADEFQHFHVVFDMVEEILRAEPILSTGTPA